MAFPPSNLIQFPARAEPPPASYLPPPPPQPIGQGCWEPYWNDHLYHLGVADWIAEEMQYLYPSVVREATPDQWAENITVDKWSSFNSLQMPVVFLEIEAANQEPNQEVHDPVYPVFLLTMWERPFDYTLWEIDEALQTVGWYDTNQADYPADPVALLRPWDVPFADPMPAAEDTACWQEYLRLDLDQSQRPEFIFVGDYRVQWDNPIGHYVEIEAAAQEDARAVLPALDAGLVETTFVTEFQNAWEVPLWPVEEMPPGAATEAPWAVLLKKSIVLFVTPMFAGGFRFSRL